jgi:hypothetical protein
MDKIAQRLESSTEIEYVCPREKVFRGELTLRRLFIDTVQICTR